MAEISDIIVSKVRVKIIKLLYSDIREMYHVRGIVRQVNEEINAVRRELVRLESSGMLKKEPRGNRVYYFIRKDYSFFEDLLSMTAKETGLGARIIQSKAKIGKISAVMFSGKFVRRAEKASEDQVDVLVIGEVVMPELANAIRIEESQRQQEINYTVMSKEEYDFRKTRRDPFLLSILGGSRVMIIGDEDDLVG